MFNFLDLFVDRMLGIDVLLLYYYSDIIILV